MPSSHSTMRIIAIVSSMRCLQFLAPRKCNWSATAILLFCLANATSAQEVRADQAQPDVHSASDVVEFLAGGAVAFVVHEGGHLFFDTVFDTKRFVETVHFGPIP